MKTLVNFNLQFFADPNNYVNVTTQNSTGSDLSYEMKEFYKTQLLKAAKPNLVFEQFAKKQPLPAGNGKTVEWRKWSSFAKATTPLTEGVTPVGHMLNVGHVTATIAQYGDYSVISDLLETTAVDNVILEATEKHADNMALTQDTIIRNQILTNMNTGYAPKLTLDVNGNVTAEASTANRAAITNTCLLTPKLVAQAAAILKSANAPKIDGAYVCICHPYVAYDLMRNKEWIDISKYQAVKQIFEGEIGMLAGVRFVESTEAKVWLAGASDAAVFANIFFGKDAYGSVELSGENAQVLVKNRGSSGSADPLEQRSTVGFKFSGAAKILMPEYIYCIESGSQMGGNITAEN